MERRRDGTWLWIPDPAEPWLLQGHAVTWHREGILQGPFKGLHRLAFGRWVNPRMFHEDVGNGEDLYR